MVPRQICTAQLPPAPPLAFTLTSICSSSDLYRSAPTSISPSRSSVCLNLRWIICSLCKGRGRRAGQQGGGHQLDRASGARGVHSKMLCVTADHGVCYLALREKVTTWGLLFSPDPQAGQGQLTASHREIGHILTEAQHLCRGIKEGQGRVSGERVSHARGTLGRSQHCRCTPQSPARCLPPYTHIQPFAQRPVTAAPASRASAHPRLRTDQ